MADRYDLIIVGMGSGGMVAAEFASTLDAKVAMQTSAHPVGGVDYPSNWHELLAWFPDDAARLRFLERLRCGEGFTRRFCGTGRGRVVVDGRRPAPLQGVSE